MWIVLAFLANSGWAFAGTGIEKTPGHLAIDGRPVEGNPAARYKVLHAALLSCPASADIERARTSRSSAGTGLIIAGEVLSIAGLAVNARLGVDIAFNGVTLAGVVLGCSAISQKRAIAAYNESCATEQDETLPAAAPEVPPAPDALPAPNDFALPDDLDAPSSGQ